MSTIADRAIVLTLAALAMSLAGCAEPGVRGETPRGESQSTTDRAMHLDLIRRMLDQQQYFAALAHIQQQQVSGRNTDELRYFEAEARRELGQFTAAEALYRGLLHGRLAAKAYHGLGLLYASRDMNMAIANLREATRRNPTDAASRSDLGYALLKARRYSEAQPELATAVELDPGSDKARNNLLLLLMVKGDETGVRRMVAAAAIAPETVSRLRRDAQAMQARTPGPGVKR